MRPEVIAWFCSGHSPPLSQIGQSSGWLISSSSITPCCALSATVEVCWVRTTMPSATVIVQLACGLGIGRPPISTSTRHCRQAPAGSSSGWSQNRGTMIPSRSQVRISSSPLGASTSTLVDGQPDVALGHRAAPRRCFSGVERSCAGSGELGQLLRLRDRGLLGDQVQELLAEVLDARW